jgi:hypothetical protein
MSDTTRFHLERDVDVTGASGTGHVADGVLWPDGTVTVRWRGERKSTVNWDRVEDAEAVHGHGGATRIVWDDVRPGRRTTRSFWVHWNSVLKQGSVDALTVLEREAKRRSYVLVNTWDAWMLPILRKHNPAIKVFVYKDASSTRRGDDQPVDLQPAGVRYADAPASWFTKDISGQRIEYSGYSHHWLMDVGNPGYQQAWADNVLLSMQKHGFDGVFIDNLLWTRDAYGRTPANYGSDAAFQTAYRGFLKTVRDRFAGSGKLMLGNLSNARLAASRWESYLQFLDGAWDEWWLAIADDNLLSEYSQGWARVVAEITACEKAGKIALVQPHFTAGSTRPFLYAWASYLMVADGRAAIAEVQHTDGYGQPTPWHVEYDWDLGSPLAPFETPKLNIHVRRFERGVAVVNANKTGTPAVAVDLGAPHGTVSLAGTSGLVLRRPI